MNVLQRFFHLLLLSIPMVIALPAQHANAAPPALAYSAPLKISAPGTYSGNYQSNGSDPAIEIYTNGQVILENCTVTGPGTLIRVWSETQLIIRNCSGYGTGESPGAFLELANTKSLLFENNYMEHVSKGVIVYQFHGKGGVSESIQIRKNIARNIYGNDRPSFVQFNQVIQVSNVEIAYNQVINEPGISSVEDNINLYNSSGTEQSPILIHDNYIQGAYPKDLKSGFTGTGMTTDGDDANHTHLMTPGNIEAMNNTFVSTCNASMNLAGGYNTRFHDNRMISSSQLPDGSGPIPAGCQWAATSSWNNFNEPAGSVWYARNSIDHNTIAFVSIGQTQPFRDRQDLSPDCAVNICHENISLPNPVTLDMEKQEWLLWNQKLAQLKIKIGNDSASNNGSQSIGEGANPFYGPARGQSPQPVAPPAPSATPVALATPIPVTTSTPVETSSSAGDGSWKQLGEEGETLTVPANSLVRYGALLLYNQKTVSGIFTASNEFFGGDPIWGVHKHVDLFIQTGSVAPASAPEAPPVTRAMPVSSALSPIAWKNIGAEGDTLAVKAGSVLRYGLNGKYVQITIATDTQLIASNEFFGSDPSPGGHKNVDLLQNSSSPAQSWTLIGFEGQSITVGANSTLRYGIDGHFVTVTGISGSFTAGNLFFGSDPAYGSRKEVYVGQSSGN